MYVRLAFSVSAWLDPDILIVDEVLAVGDQAFQKKCEERVRELTGEGRTVLFVSHSMATVAQMCQKALYLDQGRVVSFGRVDAMTREYNRDVVRQVETQTALMHGSDWRWHRARFALPDPQIEVLSDHPGDVICLGGEACSPEGKVLDVIPIERATHLTVRFRLARDLPRPLVPTFNVYDEILFVALPESTIPGKKGDYTVIGVLPPYLLNEGRFTVNANLSDFDADQTTYAAVISAFRIEYEEHQPTDPRRHGFRLPLPGKLRTRMDIHMVNDS
jgi:lipopolysaccharide transport system ATP-binding protein